MNAKERIEWIDALKGFAIFCVTLGHCNVWSPVEKYIYSFHMFVFFFLSGLLFSPGKSVAEMIKKRTKRILVPFLVWNTISSLLELLHNGNMLNFAEELLVINGNLTWNPPIWFLLVLFISQTIVIMFRLCSKKWISIISVVASLLLWTLIGHKAMLWKLNLVPMALAFFLIGYLSKNLISFLGNWYIFFPSGIIGIIFAKMNIRVVYTYGKFGNYIYCMLAAIGSVIFFVGLFSILKSFKPMRFLIEWGKNSMLIMATQYFIFKVVSFTSMKLFNLDMMKYESSVVSLIIALFTVFTISKTVNYIKEKSRTKEHLRIIGEFFGITY